MKKMFLVIALLIVVLNGLSAQVVIGPKVGLNLTKEYYGIKAMDEEIDFRTGLNVGIFGKYELNDRFDIQTELLYSQQGYKCTTDIMDIGGTMLSDGYKSVSHYLDIPVLLKYYLGKRFYIEAGSQIGFCLDSRFSSGHKEADEQLKTFDTKYNPVDFSLTGGIGFYMGHGLSVNARYIHGFTQTLPDSDWKNRVIQLSLAYDLWSF